MALLLRLAVGAAADVPARVYRGSVWPHWLANGSQFWYRNDLPKGEHEFVLVDAIRRIREPAFDHQRVAQNLSKRSGRRLQAGRLPFTGLRFDPAHPSQVLLVGPACWRLSLDSYELVEAFSELEPLPVLSKAGAYATNTLPTRIVFINRTQNEVRLSWLDAEEVAHKHSRLQPGARLDQATFEGQIWAVEDAVSGEPLGFFQAIDCPAQAEIDAVPANSPLLSPDRRKRIFVRENNLWLGSEAGDVALSRDGSPADGYGEEGVFWSPDSQKVVALRTHAASSSAPYPKPGDELDRPSPQLFNVETGQQWVISDQLFPHPLALHTFRWAADSSRFTFVYQERGHQNLRLLAVDAASGQVRPLIEEHSSTFVCDSEKFFCHWLGDGEVLWMSERSGWNHLWLFDAVEGVAKREITPGPWVVQSVEAVDEKRRRVLFRAGGLHPGQDPYAAQWCRADLDHEGVQLLTQGDGDHRLLPSPTGLFAVDTWSRVNKAPASELRSLSSGELICGLEQGDAHEVMQARRGHLPQPFVAKGRDGQTDIYGLVYFPRDFQVRRSYPVVEHIYAGPQQFSTPKGFLDGAEPEQQLADRGMIVVQCDGMGTAGRSKAFHEVCYQNLREAGFPDRIAWLRAAGRRYPQMDLSRVGIYGSSAGGANALAALLDHNDFYKVAVADCGNHDLQLDNLYWTEQWMGWPVGPHYPHNSNLYDAAKLSGKLLLLVGDLDDKVDPLSTRKMAEALRQAQREFDYQELHETHCVSRTPAGWRRLSDFLVRHLHAAG